MSPQYPWDVKTSGDLFSEPDTAATILHMMVLAAYGDEVYGDHDTDAMDPVELWVRIREDFRVTVPEESENKLNALMFALSTDAFYEDPLSFTSICMALTEGDLGDLVDGAMEQITVPEMLWGIYEVELNRDDQPEFAKSVLAAVDETIGDHAEEVDAESQDVVSSYERFVEESKEEMFRDMRRLGVEETIIRKLVLTDVTPIHDDQGNLTDDTEERSKTDPSSAS